MFFPVISSTISFTVYSTLLSTPSLLRTYFIIGALYVSVGTLKDIVIEELGTMSLTLRPYGSLGALPYVNELNTSSLSPATLYAVIET